MNARDECMRMAVSDSANITVMRRIMTLRLTTDLIYDGGPIIL